MDAVRAAAILATLPDEALRVVWLALPVEDRGRCACVCRAWRDTLADPALWTRLKPLYAGFWLRLKADHDALPQALRDLDAVLRAAAAKAAGRLEVLDFSDLSRCGCAPAAQLLLELVTANSGTLRELGVEALRDAGGPDGLLALLHAAPHLQNLNIANVVQTDDAAVALRMLRKEGAYRPLCLGHLRLRAALADIDLHALASALGAHTSLRKLELHGLRTRDAAALDALVDSALTCKICDFDLRECTVPSAFASSLARLVGGDHVEKLWVASMSTVEGTPFFDSAAVALLSPALLSNTRLTHVALNGNRIWADAAAAATLFTSLASHPSLTFLGIYHDEAPLAAAVDAAAAIAAAFAALVAASSVTSLLLSRNHLNDAFVGPLFDALPSNTRLQCLYLTGNQMSEVFMRERVLPAVRANSSLLMLQLDNEHTAAREAMDFVKQRPHR